MKCRTIELAGLALALAALPGWASEWTEEVPVRNGTETVMTLRAKIAGDFLVVEALHQPGWHSYAMDNGLRAAEKLAGRPSLGVEEGIRIEVETGGKLVGSWHQTPPHDRSQPELQWFTWSFDGTATFARRFERVGTDPVALKIGGQVCDGKSCRPIDIQLTVPLPGDRAGTAFATDDLVRVRTEDEEKTEDEKKHKDDPRPPTSQQDLHP